MRRLITEDADALKNIPIFQQTNNKYFLMPGHAWSSASFCFLFSIEFYPRTE